MADRPKRQALSEAEKRRIVTQENIAASGNTTYAGYVYSINQPYVAAGVEAVKDKVNESIIEPLLNKAKEPLENLLQIVLLVVGGIFIIKILLD